MSRSFIRAYKHMEPAPDDFIIDETGVRVFLVKIKDRARKSGRSILEILSRYNPTSTGITVKGDRYTQRTPSYIVTAYFDGMTPEDLRIAVNSIAPHVRCGNIVYGDATGEVKIESLLLAGS